MADLISLMLINTLIFFTILVVLFFVLISKGKNGEDVNGEFYKLKENVSNEDEIPVKRQALPNAKNSL